MTSAVRPTRRNTGQNTGVFRLHIATKGIDPFIPLY